MTSRELQTLIASTETDRVEKTRSTTDVDKFREAICSFSNDMAGKGLPGYLLIGVDEKDPNFRLQAADALLQQFASCRSDGQVMPLPVMNVAAHPHPEGGGDVIVVEVHPHDLAAGALQRTRLHPDRTTQGLRQRGRRAGID